MRETWVRSLGWEDPQDLPLQLRQKGVCLQCRRPRFDPWVRKIPWRRKWQPTPVLLAGKSHGWMSLAGTVHEAAESDTTERLHFHFTVRAEEIQVNLEHLFVLETKEMPFKMMKGTMSKEHINQLEVNAPR